MMRVEVAYANKTAQALLVVQVSPGATVQQCIEKSGILQNFPDIDLQSAALGIFSRSVKPTDLVQPNDRIEIYRPLEIDPKTARRLRGRC